MESEGSNRATAYALVTIGGRQVRLGMITLGGMRRRAKEIKVCNAMGDGNKELNAEELEAMQLIVCEGARGVDPTIDQSEFMNFLDSLPFDTGLPELSAAFNVVMTRSGLEKAAKEGAPKLGESAGPSSSTSSSSTTSSG